MAARSAEELRSMGQMDPRLKEVISLPRSVHSLYEINRLIIPRC